MSRNNNQYTMERKWVEAIIVGICIALVVASIQPLFAHGDGWLSALGLIAAGIVVCVLQLAFFFWNRRR